jgi:2-succinyl-6-hydroxy-2,4-cyclohexadiene-1-carboxylate synthase
MPVRDIGLNVEVAGEGPALLLLHGFTGDISTWDPFLDAWRDYRTIRVDIIGHGESDAPADSKRYRMAEAVKDILAVLDQLEVERTAVLGYSMGGRLALHLALAAPERLTALILESASPGIADRRERKARAAGDDALVDEILRDGIEAFVDRWQAQPLFASQSRLPAEVFERQRRQRLASSPVGLANSLRGMGAGRQDYLLPRLSELTMPVLLIAGALDQRYAALARHMASQLSNATIEIIEDAGHAAHLERLADFQRAISRFLESRGSGGAAPAGGARGVSPRSFSHFSAEQRDSDAQLPAARTKEAPSP